MLITSLMSMKIMMTHTWGRFKGGFTTISQHRIRILKILAK